jgi:hypothetical protein
MIRIGIDNGANGAIVALGSRGEVVLAEFMPILDPGVTRKGKRGTKKILDMVRCHAMLRGLKMASPDIFAVLEHAQPFPKEGVSTSFKSGRSYGAIEMALISLGIPYEIVRPRAWQSAILKGIEGDDTKVKAVLKCQRRLPELDLTPGRRRKAHDGLADAACMAMHAVQLSPNKSKRPRPPRK